LSHSEPMGTLDVALQHATRLLSAQPDQAAEQLREILRVVPGHPRARLLLGAASRLQGQPEAALAVLEPLAREQPTSAGTQIELGFTLAMLSRPGEAARALRHGLRLAPERPDAWRCLADQLDRVDDRSGGEAARAQFLTVANRDPRLMAAANSLLANDIPTAERLLRSHLLEWPTDVAALRMLAEVAARLRRYGDAQALLEHCLSLAPQFHGARHNYALVLFRQSKVEQALREVEQLLGAAPDHLGYRNLKAAVLAHLGEYSASIEVYEAVLQESPDQPRIWLSYGHALKTASRSEDSIAAYRRAVDLEPTLGEAYWSLANLKTFQFAAADVEAIRAALVRTDLDDEDRLHFEFALGKALEDAKDYADSFRHYTAGATLRQRLIPYSADETTRFVDRSIRLYTRDFFRHRDGAGCQATDPIFVLGMPRAGSTLLEQILSSHPDVEGTMELPDVTRIAKELVAETRDEAPLDEGEGQYFDILNALPVERFRELGERYLERTRVQRKSAAPLFVDKMPNNFLQVGLIHLMLPNARIIDARRHPLACCFSNFKQHFARGQSFSYSLEDLGRYYRDYVRLMAHMDAVLPGRVHRVIYESVVEDPETEVRRLLAYCGLPFDERCLRFYENDRAVRTASSEQVRRPIYRDGVDHWRHYEPWLDPLKAALGPVLDCYPAVPKFTDADSAPV
jgi:predicted Zn-dependent protease